MKLNYEIVKHIVDQYDLKRTRQEGSTDEIIDSIIKEWNVDEEQPLIAAYTESSVPVKPKKNKNVIYYLVRMTQLYGQQLLIGSFVTFLLLFIAIKLIGIITKVF
jgi:hypothetical protein